MIAINGVVELQAAKASVARMAGAYPMLTDSDKEYMHQLSMAIWEFERKQNSNGDK